MTLSLSNNNYLPTYLPIHLSKAPILSKALLLWLSIQEHRSTMATCGRCTILNSAFGLKDPLPPRVASLDAEAAIPYLHDDRNQSVPAPAAEQGVHSLPAKDQSNRVPRTVNDSAFNQLWLPEGVRPVCLPTASVLSGIRDLPLAPHR